MSIAHLRRRCGACLLLLLFALAASAQAKPKAMGTPKPLGYALTRHLDMATAIDAQSRALEAQLGAVAARYHTANSITPGSPHIAGSRRHNAGGNLRGFREHELEAAMPVWLPGQRDAFEATVTTGLIEVEERLALRRLDVAALLRNAWWTAQRAIRAATIARNRVGTARDIGDDMTRRVELGDAAQQDALLARNETLAAETELAQTEGALRAARVAYAVLTGGETPEGRLEGEAADIDVEDHPALRAPRASLERALSQARLVEASFIDNPEIGVFGRSEYSNQFSTDPSQPVTDQRTDSTTLGFRLKFPLPTPGRNEPRRADAAAEIERAHAEYERARRIVEAEIKTALLTVAAARRAEGFAAKRLAVASEQFELARKAFSLGEFNAVDLYRVRQSQLDAQRTRASASIDLGVALSRLNQARGYAPCP
jgi:outer membrane protein TolC